MHLKKDDGDGDEGGNHPESAAAADARNKREEESKAKGTVVKFGWLDGVYVSSNNILMLKSLLIYIIADALPAQHLGRDALPASGHRHRTVRNT